MLTSQANALPPIVFLKQSNRRSLPTPASIDFRGGVLDLVSLGLRLKPIQDKIDRIVAIERVPIDNASAKEDSPEKITPLLVYRTLHNTYTIGIVSKNLTPAKKPRTTPVSMPSRPNGLSRLASR